jgi:hypothetical protein
MRGRLVLIFSQHGSGWGGHLSVVATLHDYLDFTLKTQDESEASIRGRDALQHIEKLFRLFDKEPLAATMLDLSGLAGVVYRLIVEIHHRDSGTPEQVAWLKALRSRKA